ncbi:hypothetical protein CLV78_104117 [Aliiruegeria haliotis]|uniref:Uncharacterized protein n=1 Tax=Aliiruegeria haliotis TaxID=1280846 RepID=A0A2T0RR04_9RHOB|nr:hypothetical protein [Aliiruegeria haliotis]PRY23626.1 hypothetical protein CLV78_104117 [Aliiruegeria haliotis]
MTTPLFEAAILAGRFTEIHGPDEHPEINHVALPPSRAVRAEVAAMLREIAADPPPDRRRRTLPERLRDWVPRFAHWLRAMPLP